jgi:ABC-2 type transport system permease protein
MSKILIIAGKELKAYFTSPMAYLIAACYVGLTGYFFGTAMSKPFAEATIVDYLIPSTLILTLWAPLMTMRLFAEEERLGTLEVLLTAPVRDWDIVLGKYLASLVILAATIALTFYFAGLLFWLSDPDPGPILSGYLGLLLYGAAALAVGLFTSSLTSNQILAGTLAMSILLLLNYIQGAAAILTGWPAGLVEAISLSHRFSGFSRGLIASADVVFYLTFTAFFLCCTVKALESHRWR